MKKIASVLWAVFFCLIANAQVNDAVKDINQIKADTTYISAESTVKDWETAYDNARILLSREIEDWLTAQGVKDVSGVIANSNEHILEIKTTRGSLYRAFVYVRKSDLLPYKDKSKVMVVDIPTAKDSLSLDITEPDQIVEPEIKFTPTDFEVEMMGIKKSADIEPFIKTKKQNGKISNYGKYSTLPVDQFCYIFIYNKEGEVPACLRNDNGIAIDLSTGKQVTISDTYKGCGAIWFQLK